MNRIPVVAGVLVREGRILLGRRPAAKRHGGQWEFPGGKVGEGESEEEAMRRELAEELGIAVLGVGEVMAAFADPGSAFEVRFLVADFQGEPRALEHEALRWVTPTEALRLPLAPSDRRFAREVLPSLRLGDPPPGGRTDEGGDAGEARTRGAPQPF